VLSRSGGLNVAIAIKDIGTLQAKYTTRAQNAVQDYKAGVQQPKRSQSASAIAAVGAWQQAVSSTLAANRFTSGLRAAGDAGWQQGALTLGATRYPSGIVAGAPKWATNTAPYLQVIAGLTLPPAGIRGSDQNIARVQAVDTALHAAKVAKAGTG
jgi:hypothetical protein